MTAVGAAVLGPSVLYLLLVTAGLVRQHLAARRAVDRAARQLTEQAAAYCQFAAITAHYEETDQ